MKPNSNFNFLVSGTIKNKGARSNILPLWWNLLQSSCNTVTRHMQTNGPLPFGDLLSNSWLLSSPLPALVNHSQTVSLCLRWMRSINAYNHHVSQALWLSMPLIKFNVSISQQSKSIYSLLIEAASLACQGTYAVKMKTHLLHFNVLGTYMYRWAQIIPYSLVYMLLSGFHNSQGNDVCSSILRVFPLAVCLSLMYWYACQFWVHIWISFLLFLQIDPDAA